MARFTLQDVSIRKVGQTYDANGLALGALNPAIQNAGKEYLHGVLVNNDCPWEDPVRYVSFNDNAVKFIKTLLPAAKGGTSAEEKELPEAYKNIQGQFVEVQSPTPFHKKHLSAFPAKGNRPQINVGDLVKDYDPITNEPSPRIYTKLVVFCQYYICDGEKQFMKGSTPEEQFQQMWKNLCVPARTHTADATQTVVAASAEIPVVM